MNKLLLFIFLFLPFGTFAQAKFSADSIPLEEDKVIFQIEYKDINLKRAEIRERILYYLSNQLNAYSGRLTINDEDKTVCQTIDFLPYATSALYYYAAYMRYNLIFEYDDKFCNITLQNINFIEKDEYDKMLEYSRQEPRHKATEPVIYSAKEIMVDKMYKTFFLKNASDKITEIALDRINKMAEDIEIIFLKKQYP